jgi:hypothetical protein
MPRFIAPRSGKKKKQTPSNKITNDSSKTSSAKTLFTSNLPTPTNKTLNFDDDDEDDYVNDIQNYSQQPNYNSTVTTNAPPTSSLTSTRRRRNDNNTTATTTTPTTTNSNTSKTFSSRTNNVNRRAISGTTPIGRTDYRRSALASSLFAQPKEDSSSYKVSSPFVHDDVMKASAPTMPEFSRLNYATADPGVSPIGKSSNISFPSRSAKKAKRGHDTRYNNNNSNRSSNNNIGSDDNNNNGHHIQMSGASTARANMALIKFSDDNTNNGGVANNEKKLDPFEDPLNNQLVVSGPIVIPPPPPIQPQWPVRPVYDVDNGGRASVHGISPTQAILNKVLNENGIRTEENAAVKARLDPADYMAKSFRVSFGLNGRIVSPNKMFSPSLNRETHTVQFQKLAVSKNILYVPALKEQLQASQHERVFETKKHARDENEQKDGEKMEEDADNNGRVRYDEFGLPIFPLPTGPRLVSLLHRYQKCYDNNLFVNKNMPPSLARDENLWHSRSVWGLFNVLWGRELDPQLEDALKVQYFNDNWQFGGLYIAEANDNPQNDDVSVEVHRLRVARRLALCHWLNAAITTCPSIQAKDRMFENVGGRGGLHSSTITPFSILNELTKLNISHATEMAMENGDLRLATLLSQSVGSQVTRDYISTQVDMWRNWGIVSNNDDQSGMSSNYIDDARQRIYLLLSGQLTEKKLRLKEFHWLQAFAMHLCFNVDTKCGSNGSIRHGLVSYRDASNSNNTNDNNNATAAPPQAWYEIVSRVGEQANSTSLIVVPDDGEIPNNISSGTSNNNVTNGYKKDTMFQLLQLAFEPGQSHAEALAEHCNTSGSFEHHLSWHLLTALDGLGIWQVSNFNEHARDSLIGNFIEELEIAGLWHWAVYIALYLSSTLNKRETVLKLLHLHCPSNEEEALQQGEQIKQRIEDMKVLVETAKTAKARAYNQQRLKLLENKLEHSWEYVKSFLINTIGIPEVMIDRALAQRAFYEKQQYPEMRYQFASGDWDGLHRNVINVLMPQCMLHRHWVVSGINKSNVNNVSGNRGRDLSSNDLHMDFLRSFVATLQMKSEVHLISGWDTVGSVLAEYLNIESTIINLTSGETIDLHQLFHRVVALCASLNRLILNHELNHLNDAPINDQIVKLRLICIKEIAAEAKNWYIVLSKECNDIGLHNIEHLEKLVRIPLTIDHRLKALRMLESTHFKNAILDQTL